jgi:hypothetical protein
MSDTYILAIDLAKRSFQVCATTPGGAVLFNRMVSRAKLEDHVPARGVASVCPPCFRCSTGLPKVWGMRFG